MSENKTSQESIRQAVKEHPMLSMWVGGLALTGAVFVGDYWRAEITGGETRHEKTIREHDEIDKVQNISEVNESDIHNGKIVYDSEADKYVVYIDPLESVGSEPTESGWHEISTNTFSD